MYIKLSSGGERKDYVKCELIGGEILFLAISIVGCPLHPHQYTLCIVAMVDYPYTPCCLKYQNMPYLVALHLCWVSYYFLRGLGNIAQTNTIADILIEDQLRPPMDMIAVDQVGELHKTFS